MVTIGIDPSLNSTGICVNVDGKCTYFIITSKMTKKMKKFKHDRIMYVPYDKQDTNKKENSYAVVESNKANNINKICTGIRDIIYVLLGGVSTDTNKPLIQEKSELHVNMEGVSYGSVGSAALVDLSGLNFAIRNMLIELGISFTIVSPSQNKKFATGNGAADKELMVYSWLMVEKDLKNITDIKIDDLADAYFLSNYKPAEGD